MHYYFLTEPFLYTLAVIAFLLLCFYFWCSHKTSKRLHHRFLDDHMSISDRIEKATLQAELALLQIDIKAFSNEYCDHFVKEYFDKMLADLCWQMRDKENELKIRS